MSWFRIEAASPRRRDALSVLLGRFQPPVRVVRWDQDPLIVGFEAGRQIAHEGRRAQLVGSPGEQRIGVYGFPPHEGSEDTCFEARKPLRRDFVRVAAGRYKPLLHARPLDLLVSHVGGALCADGTVPKYLSLH